MSTLHVDVSGTVGALSLRVAFRAAETPLVIVGPNGAGKTTLLMMILGALRPARGRIALDDVALFDSASETNVPVESRHIGFLPQRYALFPHLDAAANVAYGITAASGAERRRLAIEALAHLDVAGLAPRRPPELSGGEAQRVALARALASRPQALVLDEPFAALDASVRRDVRRFLVERLRAWHLPTVVVTHDRADAEAFEGELVVIERGTVVQTGRLATLAANPATEFVARFVAGDRRAG
jgi:molybdate transport system ATP-binding protein